MKEGLKKHLLSFNMMQAEDVDACVSYFEDKIYTAGEFFLKEGRLCQKLGFIVSGGVKMFSTDFSGKENVTCFKFENQFITSYTDFVAQQVSKKSIQCIERSAILTLSHAAYSNLLLRFPAWQSLATLLLEKDYEEKERYLLTYGNQPAEEKYRLCQNQFRGQESRLTLADLASYLGITSRTLSRIKGKQKKEFRL